VNAAIVIIVVATAIASVAKEMIVAGSAIVAVGGGGIQPMRQRWQNALDRYDEEKPRLRHEVQAAKQRRASGETSMVAGQGNADMTRSPEQAPHHIG
jgi:hypothetical protein